jgi:hypothetical protein
MSKNKRSAFPVWLKFKRWSPASVRLVSQEHGSPTNSETIASRMGIDVHLVDHISLMSDWSKVDVVTAEKFLKACDCDFEDRKVNNRMRMFMQYQASQAAPMRWKALKRDDRWESFWKHVLASAFKGVSRA